MKKDIFSDIPMCNLTPTMVDVRTVVEYLNNRLVNRVDIDNTEQHINIDKVGSLDKLYRINLGSIADVKVNDVFEVYTDKICGLYLQYNLVRLRISTQYSSSVLYGEFDVNLNDVETWVDAVKKIEHIIDIWFQDLNDYNKSTDNVEKKRLYDKTYGHLNAIL